MQTLLNIFKLKGVAITAHDDGIYIHDQYEDPVDAVGKMLLSYGFEKRSKFDYAKGMTSITLLLPTGGDIVLIFELLRVCLSGLRQMLKLMSSYQRIKHSLVLRAVVVNQ